MSSALVRKFEQNFFTEKEEIQCPIVTEFENLNVTITFEPKFTGIYKTQLQEEYNTYLNSFNNRRVRRQAGILALGFLGYEATKFLTNSFTFNQNRLIRNLEQNLKAIELLATNIQTVSWEIKKEIISNKARSEFRKFETEIIELILDLQENKKIFPNTRHILNKICLQINPQEPEFCKDTTNIKINNLSLRRNMTELNLQFSANLPKFHGNYFRIEKKNVYNIPQIKNNKYYMNNLHDYAFITPPHITYEKGICYTNYSQRMQTSSM